MLSLYGIEKTELQSFITHHPPPTTHHLTLSPTTHHPSPLFTHPSPITHHPFSPITHTHHPPPITPFHPSPHPSYTPPHPFSPTTHTSTSTSPHHPPLNLSTHHLNLSTLNQIFFFDSSGRIFFKFGFEIEIGKRKRERVEESGGEWRRGMEGEMWRGEWVWMWIWIGWAEGMRGWGDVAMGRCDGLSKRKSAKDHNDAMRW